MYVYKVESHYKKKKKRVNQGNYTNILYIYTEYIESALYMYMYIYYIQTNKYI